MTSKSHTFLITLIFLGLTLIFTFPLILGLDKYVYGPFFNTDIRGGIWHLWWGHYALKAGLDYYHCPFIAAPMGVDFSQQPVSWIVEYSLAAFLMVLSPIFCINLLTILNFVLCGFFSYLLMRHLTKNNYASFLSAVIFTFSPYHINKVMEFSFFYTPTWLILCVYSFMKIREKFEIKYVFYAALAATMTVAFNPYYGYFLFIFMLGFLSFCLFYQWKDKIKLFATPSGALILKNRMREARRFLVATGTVIVMVLLLNMPTFLKIANNLSAQNTNKVLAAASGYSRPVSYVFAQSARPLSYLLPASTHPVFGDFTKKMFGSIFYGRGSIEQTLYLGWIPLALAYLAFWQWRRKRLLNDKYPKYQSSRENFYIGFFLFSAIIAFVCSLPPYADLGFFKIYFPSYFLHKALPMFRAYARMGVLVSLCIAALGGYGLKSLLDRFRTQRGRLLFTTLVGLVVLFEFTNMPPARATDISHVPEVYKWLAAQKGDFIIAEYPMPKAVAGEAQENYDYLFYQTIHHKRMFNGSVLGTEAFEIREKVSKIDAPETLQTLKEIGVKYVIFHSEPYRRGDHKKDMDIIGEVPQLDRIAGWKLVEQFGDVSVYEIR
ncbi:MAG TPA: hypothetical protein DCL35_02435 [Candidatus Omnitrophica bacterium]|nr:hypothetical protein [Candidatus Omnitrophota bacterium]